MTMYSATGSTRVTHAILVVSPKGPSRTLCGLMLWTWESPEFDSKSKWACKNCLKVLKHAAKTPQREEEQVKIEQVKVYSTTPSPSGIAHAVEAGQFPPDEQYGGGYTMCGLIGWVDPTQPLFDMDSHFACKNCLKALKSPKLAQRATENAKAPLHSYLIGTFGWGDVEDLYYCTANSAMEALEEYESTWSYRDRTEDGSVFVYEMIEVGEYERAGWRKK